MAGRRRKWLVPLTLFLATCASTFFAGATSFMPIEYLGDLGRARMAITTGWEGGLLYMSAVLAILLTHEMGHFVMTIRYGIPATYPLFIPVPINAIGTMGAVIAMDGLKANRREMFDLGLAGPVAGLLVAVPVLGLGILQLDLSGPSGQLEFHNPLLARLLIGWLRPDLPTDTTVGVLQLNPLFMAGWVGMLITGLNMLPVSQLDGGHVVYALFGRRAHVVARVFLVTSIALVVIYVDQLIVWVPMLVLVTLLGADHPPTSDDRARMGPLRWAVGVASLVIPILCFPLWGISI